MFLAGSLILLAMSTYSCFLQYMSHSREIEIYILVVNLHTKQIVFFYRQRVLFIGLWLFGKNNATL